MCQALQISQLYIESDSTIVVSAITSALAANWLLEYALRDCLSLVCTSFVIKHLYRQKNCVADRLAYWAHDHCRWKEGCQHTDLPPWIYGFLKWTNLGLWNFRP